MKKLNKSKIKWIVREVKKRNMGVYSMAKLQDITKQHVPIEYIKNTKIAKIL